MMGMILMGMDVLQNARLKRNIAEMARGNGGRVSSAMMEIKSVGMGAARAARLNQYLDPSQEGF